MYQFYPGSLSTCILALTQGELALLHGKYVTSRPQLAVTPATCTTDREVHDHWQVYTSKIGATFDEDMYYHITAACLEYADYHVQTYDSGHGIWKAGIGYVYDGSGNQKDEDGDGYNSCNGMNPHETGFIYGTNVWGVSGIHTYVRVSSGSACTFFDTYDAINFYWY